MSVRLKEVVLATTMISAGMMMAGGAVAQEMTDIQFTLDWVPQSIHGPFFIALQQGYYEEEGLNVTIDAGRGSADAVRRIISGTHDMGFPDINALIEFNSENPDSAITAVMMIYEQAPFAVTFLEESGITEPQDLEGRTLGAPAFDASFKLFPAFAAAAGIDVDQVATTNMDPLLRETMLVRREVDAIAGHITSSLLDLEANNVSRDEVGYFLYSDYGAEFYGNAVAASSRIVEENPEAVAGFVRATIRAMQEMLENPELGVESVVAFEPLVNADIERGRLELAMECCLLTPTVIEEGIGAVDMDRLTTAIEAVAEAFGLARVPSAEEMFDPSFLPPQEERMTSASAGSGGEQ